MSARRQGEAPFREAEINLDALSGNLSLLREAAADQPTLVDVGANAWGHGVDVLVPALLELGVQGFVVTRLVEAEAIRTFDPQTIIVSTQHSANESFARAAALGVTPAIRSENELHRCFAAQVTRLILVEDDGNGIPAFDAEAIRRASSEAQGRGVEVWRSSDVRPLGAELLGLSENADVASVPLTHPVLRLWAPVTATKQVGSDEGVSYGYTYRTAAQTTLALVSLGYSDGISRAGGSRVPVLIAERTHTVAGRMAMDAFMVDLGDVPAPALGAEATVLGDERRGEPTAVGLGRILGMSSAEITTRLTARPRRYAGQVNR